VKANLVDTAVSLLRSRAFAVAGIIHARPTLVSRLHHISSGRPYAVLSDLEKAVAAYLAAEKTPGRIPAATDSDTHAFILVGTIYHIFMTNTAESSGLRRRLQRILSSLVADPDDRS
jgi:hypothetical protein